MSRLLVVLLLSVAGCWAKRNGTDTIDFCAEYADCMGRANQKSAECLADNATAAASSGKEFCEGALELHKALQALYDEKNEHVEICVRERMPEAANLSHRKLEKCRTAMRKVKRDMAEKRQKRKEKREKKEKPKSCAREAKRMRWQCAKIAKCCSVVKDCNVKSSEHDQIAEKKKELKQLYSTCNVGEKKKLNRKNEKQGGEENKEKKAKDEKPHKKQQKEQKKKNKEEENLSAAKEQKQAALDNTKIVKELPPAKV
ncbi:unnamed protein product [Cylicocyclus nassatus]|uniref:Uncharacterized protein n=1 Tax=Cylicocyclus nassatus TaxID=53992 RepID=A0AA36DLF0_CYLNA|nr:unnamed protein product [Cylicocyclus nassatus]